jgi:hypothetical protein
MNYFLRVAIAFDQFVQACCNKGTIGITISARAGTAEAHGKRWGIWLSWLLDRTPGFGGPGHCLAAIRNDRLRAHVVLKELSEWSDEGIQGISSPHYAPEDRGGCT